MHRKSGHYVWLILIFLLGFGLRLYLLGDKNVWWDEGYSVWLIRMPMANMLETTAYDTHPPLYFILLRWWVSLLGDGEFVLRYPSLLVGVLTLPVVYRLGARLFEREWAIFGTLLLAISRFHIWWSQETRMYAMAVGLITLAAYAFIRQVRTGRSWRGWVFYTLVVTAMLASFYLSVLMMVAAGLGVLILWAARRVNWRYMAGFALANVGVFLLYLPWTLYALPRVRSGTAAEPFTPLHVLKLYLSLLATGISEDLDAYLPIVIVYGLILVVSLVALIARRRWEAVAVLAVGPILPPLVIYQFTWLNWRFFSPAPAARYFLLFVGVGVLIPAAGAAMLSRWRRWAGVMLAVCVTGIAIWALPGYYETRYLRDQWKSAVDIIAAYAEPDDVLVMVSADRYPIFLYEYARLGSDAPPNHGVPDGSPRLEAGIVDEQMLSAIGDADRVWLVEIEAGILDPDGLARAWMDAHNTPVLSSQFDHNRLTLYSTDGLAPIISQAAGELPSPYLPVQEYRPGDTVHLGVYTSTEQIGLRMIHQSGLVLAERLASGQADGIVRHDITFPITQATPRGRYTIEMDNGHSVTFHVTHSDPLLREQAVPTQQRFMLGNEVELLGYRISPTMPKPGDTIVLDLYWRAPGTPGRAYTVFTQIVGPMNPATGYPLWGQHDSPPVEGTFPTNQWPAGLIVRDRHMLTLDPQAPQSSYTLIVGLYDPETGDRLSVPDRADGAVQLVTFEIKTGD
ncbi:MAG: glycosyltransferase family 39 protein [Anaerolineae bacterium]|nr:glycosyltransferase family 39 protein [Anaerolineae bacterium]